jgi:hypothetical protein
MHAADRSNWAKKCMIRRGVLLSRSYQPSGAAADASHSLVFAPSARITHSQCRCISHAVQKSIDIGINIFYTIFRTQEYVSMATIKTAISLQVSLFEQVEDLARNLNVSRSHVVALALEEFVQRHHNHQLLDAINQAYDGSYHLDDLERTPARRQQHRDIIEGEW